MASLPIRVGTRGRRDTDECNRERPSAPADSDPVGSATRCPACCPGGSAVVAYLRTACAAVARRPASVRQSRASRRACCHAYAKTPPLRPCPVLVSLHRADDGGSSRSAKEPHITVPSRRRGAPGAPSYLALPRGRSSLVLVDYSRHESFSGGRNDADRRCSMT